MDLKSYQFHLTILIDTLSSLQQSSLRTGIGTIYTLQSRIKRGSTGKGSSVGMPFLGLLRVVLDSIWF